MKKLKPYVIFGTALFAIVSCQEGGSSSNTPLAIAGLDEYKYTSPLESSFCELPPEDGLDIGYQIERCGFLDGCQAILDDSYNYLGCIPIPVDTGTGDTGTGDTGTGGTGTGDTGTGGTGTGDTGSGGTGTGDTGSGDTGSGDTGSGDTGSGDTGSGDTGSGDTGSGDTGSGDTGSDDDSDDDQDEEDNEDNEDNEDDEDDEVVHACSDPSKPNHKVLVCHSNNGNKGYVTICIAKNAWENAHQQSKHHKGKDYLGACEEDDLD